MQRARTSPEINTAAFASSTVARNVVANFVSGTWTGVMALAFTPLYIKFIGIESYALIGIYTSLRALFAVLDMGLSLTLNRELARLSVMQDAKQLSRDLVRTFEVIYWSVGLLIGGVLVLSAPLLTRHWLHTAGVSIKAVEQAVMIMGLVLAFEWPVNLYAGGLMGLQRQILLNMVRIIAATVRSIGAIFVLWLISPTIQGYFTWQIIVTAAQTLAMAACLWRLLAPTRERAAFRRSIWVDRWRFAAGISGITLLATVLTQLDKIILSKRLALDFFGYYAVAAAAAASLSYIAAPIFSAVFPRLTQAVAENKKTELALLYHKSCQLMSLFIVPAWIMAALFSKELLTLWLRNAAIVKNTYVLLSLLVTGTAFNSIMVLPLALQLAHGWTKLSFYKNVVSVVLFVPLLLWFIKHYGPAGAAVAWIALNAGYILFEIPLMHRRLLKGEMWRWYLVDIGVPLLVSLSVGICARVFSPSGTSGYLALLYIAAVSLVALLSSGLATPSTRSWLQNVFRASTPPAHANT